MTTTIKQHINSLPLDERPDFIKDYNELQTELKQLNNMTKVSVFGQKATESKQLKPIEFKYCVDSTGKLSIAAHPSTWMNVQLFAKKYRGGEFDLILAWDDNPNNGAIYLGHWNDGVI